MKKTEKPTAPKKNIQKIEWILKGFVLGTACLVPGISAGTLALIMGIYEKCIFAITNMIRFSKKIKDDIIFLLFLTIGMMLAIFLLTNIISKLLESFPVEVYSIFTGLIVASLPKLFKLTSRKKNDILLIFFITIVFFILFKIIPGFSQPSKSLPLFFISGVLSFFASVLPGFSGGVVLLLLGTYHFILNAITEWFIKELLVFLTGGGIGLLCAFYFTRVFLKKRKNLFFCLAIGFVIGSLPEIIPYKQWAFLNKDLATLKFIAFICIGAGLFFLLEKSSSSIKKKIT